MGPCTWVLLPGVEAELERLENERTKKKSLLLSLLRSRALRLETEKLGHTDDVLVACARENNWATLTVDTALKRRLYEANLPVIEVRQNNHLHVVEFSRTTTQRKQDVVAVPVKPTNFHAGIDPCVRELIAPKARTRSPVLRKCRASEA